MMLGNRMVMGAMALAVVVAFASGWWQRDSIQRAYVPDEVAEETGNAEDVQVAEVPEDEAPEERTATAPARVVDSAGFPVTEGPIVTVNGRPLGSDEALESPPSETAAADVTAGEPIVERDMAAVETPPIPVPRPSDLPEPPRTASVPAQQPSPAGQRIDYEAITASAHGQPGSSVEFMNREERQRIAPLPPEPIYGNNQPGGYDPRAEGLVQVVTPNGDVIWVYEDQVDRRQGAQLVGPVGGSNPLGFIYDSFDYRR